MLQNEGSFNTRLLLKKEYSNLHRNTSSCSAFIFSAPPSLWWPILAWVIIWKYHCHNRDLGRPCKTRTAHKNAHEFITLS